MNKNKKTKEEKIAFFKKLLSDWSKKADKLIAEAEKNKAILLDT